MGQLYDRATDSGTGVAAGGTVGPTNVKTAGKSDDLEILVDDNAGGAPASYSLEVEVYDAQLDTWFTFKNIAASTSASHTVNAVGDKMRSTLTNESGASSDYRQLLRAHK